MNINGYYSIYMENIHGIKGAKLGTGIRLGDEKMKKRISGILLLISILFLAFSLVYTIWFRDTLQDYQFLILYSIWGICFFLSMLLRFVGKKK